MNLPLSQSAPSGELLSASTIAPALDQASLTTAVMGLGRASQSLLFIAGGVQDYSQLVAGVAAGTEVHVLDPVQDAVAQITQVLLGRQGISSLHIVSHGERGGLDFGSSRLNLTDFPGYAAQLQSWGQALTDSADILLYGCDVAAGELGQAFVQILSQVTGADVAASDDLTGSAALGGDWTLEYQTGDIEAFQPFNSWTQAAYSHTLATFTVLNTNDSGADSLRQAILDANAAAGDDTITFTGSIFVDGTPDIITLTSGELGISSNISLVGTGANLLTISGNNASRVFNISSGVVGIDGVTIANGNSGSASGGGLFNSGTLTLTNSIIQNNTTANAVNGDNGGGLYNQGTVTISDSILRNNTGFVGGALVNAAGSTASLTNTTVANNTGNQGGAIQNEGSMTINSSTISGNTSINNGGGIMNIAATASLSITNSTISGNTGAAGGGIRNTLNATLTLANVTIANNTATASGGGVSVGSGTVNVKNTLIANNIHTSTPDVAGTFVDQGNNLIGKGNGSTGFTNGSNGNIVGTIAAPIDPLLAALGNYGGTTQTHALLPGSAAINAGTSTGAPTADQRGIARVGAADIGAFESRGFIITASGGSDQSTPRNTFFDGPLFATVSSAFGEPVNGGVITFTAPATGASTTTPTQTATIAAGQAIVTQTANDTVGSYSVSASANGIATPASFSLTNTNTRPVVTPVSKTGQEDTPVSFTSADFTDQFTDDNGDSLSKIQITALPTKGTLQLGGVNVIVNQEITATQLATLTYVPNADSNGTDSFGWNGSDGLDYATTGATVNLTLAAINDAPLLSLPTATVTVGEDAGAQTVANFATLRPGPATATDEAGQTLTATSTVTSTTGNLAFTTAPAIDAAGNLTFQTALNTFGTATVSVVVTDSGSGTAPNVNTSSTQTFTITVNSVNDQPSFTAANPPTVNEDAGAQTVSNWATFNPGPADEAGQTATYTVSNISNSSLFSVAPSIAPNGTLTYTPAANANGTVTFDVRVQDNGGTANGGSDTSLVQTFTLTINPVNDAPSFTPGANQTVLEGSGAQTVSNWVAAFNPGPANEAGQSALSYTVVSVSDPSLFTPTGQPAIAPDGTLTYTPVSDLNTAGTATISVQVRDNGGTANSGADTSTIQTFTITVNPVNDRPSFSASNPAASLEDAGVQTIANWASFNPGDPTESAQTATYTVSNLSNAALFAVAPTITANGTLTYRAAANAFGTSTFDVRVQDNGGTANGGIDTSVVQTFTLTVTPVNDAPSVTPGANQSVSAGAGAQTVANFASFNPGPANEAGQTATYTIVNNSNPGLFSVQPTIAPNGTLIYTPVGTIGTATTATLTVQVQDNGGTANGGVDTSSTQTFTITVTPANRQPSFSASNPAPSLEDGGVQTLAFATFNPGDPTESAQTATYTVNNLTNANLFSVAPTIASDGTLTYTAAPNAFGTATFDVTVRDNGGTANGGVDTSTTQTFTLTVRSVNDAPSFAPNANPVVTAGAGTQTIANFASFNSGATNEAGQTATYTIVSNSNPSLFSGQPTIAPDGTLVYTPVASLNSPQTATLTVQVQDSGGTANGGFDTSPIQSFTITVNPAPLPTPPATGAAPVFTIFQLRQTFTLNRANQKLLAGQPSPALQQLFDEEYYLRQNPDVAAACDRGVFQSGFQHFLQYGQFEGRNPSSLFNEQFYLSQNSDVAAAVARGNFRSGFQHFLQYGQFEGRSFSTLYNEQSYLAQNSDVVAAIARGGFRTGFQHFLQFGFAEGRLPSLTLFNERYYLSQNPDVAAAVARGVFKNGLHHFEQYGQFEGRQPSTLFSERYYLSQNPDVAAAVAQGRFKSGFDHYLDFGRFEGRAGIG
jgi:hypothetical protein